MKKILFCLLICVSCAKDEAPIKDVWSCGYDLKRSDQKELVRIRGLIFSREFLAEAEANACEPYNRTIEGVTYEKVSCGCDYEVF